MKIHHKFQSIFEPMYQMFCHILKAHLLNSRFYQIGQRYTLLHSHIWYHSSNALPGLWVQGGNILNKTSHLIQVQVSVIDVISYGLNHLKIFLKCFSSKTLSSQLSNDCKSVRALLFAFKDEFRNSFFVKVHEILCSAFQYIKSDSLLKSASKKWPLMEVALLASKMIDVGFVQGPSINGINFKIFCRCCGKNVLKDPDDDSERFLSAIDTLEDAMLSLPKACYFHWLKSVVMFGTKTGNARVFSSEIGCFILYQEKKNLILITFDQYKLDFCFGDDQFIVCAMNGDKRAHELSFNIIEAMFHHFIAQNSYYFNVYTLIGQQINKRP